MVDEMKRPLGTPSWVQCHVLLVLQNYFIMIGKKSDFQLGHLHPVKN